MNRCHLRALPLALIAFASLAALAPAAGAAELIVIVAAGSPVGALRIDQVADIFLGQVARFPDGREAVALDLGLGSALRDEFYIKVAARKPALMKAHWTKMIFTGRGQPPKEAPTSAAVRKLVADNPALIGYIDRAALDPSVKPVLLLP
jgi:ABC-type phosphate transport system substrate-binding protein